MATRVKITSRYPTNEEIAEITRIPKARRERIQETQLEARRLLLAKKMKAAANKSSAKRSSKKK